MGQEQIAVACLHDAAAEMPAARRRPFLPEDHLDVVEPRRAASSIRRALASEVRAPPLTGSA